MFCPRLFFCAPYKLLAGGGAIAVIEFGEGETLELFAHKNPDAIALFAVDPKGRLMVVTAESTSLPLGKGWKLIALSANFAPQADPLTTMGAIPGVAA